MTLEEEIQYQKEIIQQVDGKSPLYNIGNRIYGLANIAFASFAYYSLTDQNPATLLACAPFILEGATDLISGKHHTILFKLFKVHPKYKLEKLLNEQKKRNALDR